MDNLIQNNHKQWDFKGFATVFINTKPLILSKLKITPYPYEKLESFGRRRFLPLRWGF